MVLVTHQLQSSYTIVPFETLSPCKGGRSKHNGVRFQMVSRKDRSISKHAYTLRSICPCVRQVKGKRLQISSFKGNVQNDGGDLANKSKLSKNSVKISTVSQIRDETVSESSTPHDLSVPYTSESDKPISGSKVIRKLFEKWLNILHSGAPNEIGNDVVEGLPQVDLPQEQKTTTTNGRGEILKVVLCYFLGLDASITVPLIIFIPLYLAVNVVYGAEVSRELTPLWVIGPPIVALYVKLVRGIVALYIFSFKQTIKIIKDLPSYYSISYEYIVKGKLKEEIRARLLQPMINLRNGDYKELSRRKLKALQEWLMEKYLDYVESIWPYYCRMIRFLKSANLI
ncbi:hypothetical protein vseg_008700 [Gypsophila vaccaria]